MDNRKIYRHPRLYYETDNFKLDLSLEKAERGFSDTIINNYDILVNTYEPRTLHSFRHTRITDQLKGEDEDLKYVQDRAGHSDPRTTQRYVETTFDVPPKSLEQYLDEKGISKSDFVRKIHN